MMPAEVNAERRVAEPIVSSHPQGLLGSMRLRIVLAVVGLLAFSAAVSIFLLRSVLLDRLDEEITVALSRASEASRSLTAT